MRVIQVTALILLVGVAAHGQTVADCYNGVGIFMSEQPSPVFSCTEYAGGPGQITAYVVLVNPYNEHTETPIEQVGGYEFRLDHPPGLFVQYCPDLMCEYPDAPEFKVFGNYPVIDGQAVLMSLTIGSFTTDEAAWFVRPLSDAGDQSISGEIAVYDLGDASVSRATPVSYSFDEPVFIMYGVCDPLLGQADGIWGDCWVVPAAKTTWGELRATFR